MKTSGSMSPGAPVGDKKSAFGAFSLSVIIHLVALLLVGSTVIFEGVIPKSPFSAVDASLVSSVEEPVFPEIPETTDTMEVPQLSNDLNPVMAEDRVEQSSTVDMIVSTGANPQFSLPSATGTPSPLVKVDSLPAPAQKQADPAKTTSSTVRALNSLFGSSGAVSHSLTGTFYDLKQTREGKPTEIGKDSELDSSGKRKFYLSTVNEFLDKRWDARVLERFFRAGKPLHTTQVFIPHMNAGAAPKAFDVEKDVAPTLWLVHYKGAFTAPKSGRFRFVGFGDDLLIVRLDDEIVLQAGLFNTPTSDKTPRTNVGSVVTDQPRKLDGGPWFRLIQGKSYPLEVLMGEIPGGHLSMFILIQEEGVDYPVRPDGGGPLLPVFQTAPTRLPKFQPGQGAPHVAPDPFSGLEG